MTSDLVALVRLDAVICAAAGLVLAVGAPLLDGLLGVSIAALLPLGLVLIAYAVNLRSLARRGAPVGRVKGVIVGNVVWAAASVVVVVADWLTLTTAGTLVVLLQAAAVAVLAGLQFRSLPRPRLGAAR